MSIPAKAPLSLLLAHDEPALRETLRRAFALDGHRVTAVADGASAIDRAMTDDYDVVLLGVCLRRGPDGYQVCRALRSRRNLVPIIMLTGPTAEADVVRGLDAGADDYLTKPLGLTELRSRITAIRRRTGSRALGDEVVVAGSIKVDRVRREVSRAGVPVRLTFCEFQLLDRLVSDPGRLFDRHELLRAIWSSDDHRDPRAIDVHVRHVRCKLEEDPARPRLIVTVRGAGYRLNAGR